MALTIGNMLGLTAVKVGSAYVQDITQQSNPTSVMVEGTRTDGQIYKYWQSVKTVSASASFTTHAIAAALNACGLIGKNLGAEASSLVMYGQPFGVTGRGSGSVFRSLTMASGVLVPKTLQASGDGDATISYEATLCKNGVNDMVALADAAAGPAIVPTDYIRWCLGPIYVAGIALDHISSLSIDFGVAVQTKKDAAEICPTACWIDGIEPKITISGISKAWLSGAELAYTDTPTALILPGLGNPNADPDGEPATPAYLQGGILCGIDTSTGVPVAVDNTFIYLKARQLNADFEADDAGKAIKISTKGVAHVESILDVNGNDVGEVRIIIDPYHDGTNAPLVIDTAADIEAYVAPEEEE